jgi:ABC-type transport system involved in cytochrome c biogenesis permease subunit
MINAFAALPFYILGLWKRPFLYVGLAVQSAYIVSRGLQLGRLPLVGPHDTLIFLSASMVAFSFPFGIALKRYSHFFRGISVAAVIFTLAGVLSKQHNAPLPPVLKTVWFELHVVCAFLSYALFGIGAVVGAFYLKRKDDLLEGIQYRALLIGYCLFSLSMIFGGIWAYLAWGTYWLWTPKELWTSIVWVFYSLYLHARFVKWWTGRPAAVLGIAGFLVVIFTYLGVSLLMKSSHTF